MPSIFLWKVDPSVPAPRSTLTYTRGPGWWLEEEKCDRPVRSRSFRLHKSTRVTESVTAFDTECMPTDWVGEDLFETVEVPYQFYKFDPVYGRLDRVDEWMRWTTIQDLPCTEDDLQAIWKDAQGWIHSRHKVHEHHPAGGGFRGGRGGFRGGFKGEYGRGQGEQGQEHGHRQEHVREGFRGGRGGFRGRGGRGGRDGHMVRDIPLVMNNSEDHFHETKKRQ